MSYVYTCNIATLRNYCINIYCTCTCIRQRYMYIYIIYMCIIMYICIKYMCSELTFNTIIIVTCT